jgi:HAD superfamily hydrolase (TIGR01490 family)
MSTTRGAPDPKTELVFVDLDRCLLRDDSVGGFLTHLVRRGLLPPQTLIGGAWSYLVYRLNLGDPAALVRRGVRGLAGYREEALRDEASAFFYEHTRFRYRDSLLARIEAHRLAGAQVFLLTGGLPYLPQLVAGDLDLAGAITTRAEVHDGVYTGRILEPACVGTGKIVHAQRAAEATGLALSQAWFYTDSHSDWPMLRVVARPVAVNPDRKLRRSAERIGWPIIDD